MKILKKSRSPQRPILLAGLLATTFLASAAPAQEPAPATYYRCLATEVYSPNGVGGLATERLSSKDPATPFFDVDVRNGAITGELLPGFGDGQVLVRQPGPGETWVAWWIRRGGQDPGVNSLRIYRSSDAKKSDLFIATYRDQIYSGFCGPAPAGSPLRAVP